MALFGELQGGNPSSSSRAERGESWLKGYREAEHHRYDLTSYMQTLFPLSPLELFSWKDADALASAVFAKRIISLPSPAILTSKSTRKLMHSQRNLACLPFACSKRWRVFLSGITCICTTYDLPTRGKFPQRL